jgi:hypothetical protein
MDQLTSRKFINTIILNIIFGLIIYLVPELRQTAMLALLANNGIYTIGNVADKLMTQTDTVTGKQPEESTIIQPAKVSNP